MARGAASGGSLSEGPRGGLLGLDLGVLGYSVTQLDVDTWLHWDLGTDEEIQAMLEVSLAEKDLGSVEAVTNVIFLEQVLLARSLHRGDETLEPAY